MNTHVEVTPGAFGQMETGLNQSGQPAVDPAAEPNGSRKTENGQAAALLGQLRSELADIRRALGGTTDGAARLRLLDAASQVQGAMSQVYEAVNSGNGNNVTIAMPDVSGAIAGATAESDGSAVSAAADAGYRMAFDAMRDNTRKVIHELFDDRTWINDLNIDDPKKKKDFVDAMDQIGARAEANDASGTLEGKFRAAADAQIIQHSKNRHNKHLTQADIDKERRTDEVLEEARRRLGNDPEKLKKADEWLANERQEVSGILEKKGFTKAEIEEEFSKHKYNPSAAMTDLLDRGDKDLRDYYKDVKKDYKNILNLDVSSLRQDGQFLGLSYKFLDDPTSKTELLWASDNTTGRQSGSADAKGEIPASGRTLSQDDIERAHKADVLLALARQRAQAEGHGDQVQQWLSDESKEVGKLLESKGLAKDAVDAELAKHKDNPIAVARSMLDPASLASYYDDVKKDVASILNLSVDPVTKDGKVTEVTYKFTDTPSAKAETLWAYNPSEQPTLIQTALASNSQDDIGATLRSAGMKLTGGDVASPSHGLSIEKPALSGQGVVVA